MEKVYEYYVKGTPEQVWRAMTDPDERAKYNFGIRIEAELVPGRPVRGVHPTRGVVAEGFDVEVVPNSRLVRDLRSTFDDEVASEGYSRVVWEIEPVGDCCRLTVTQGGMRDDANPKLYDTWPMILSGLKTLVETGETLTTPGAPFYAP